MVEFSAERPCRILSLDGGGAKGFYTLGVLREVEGLLGCRLYERFDLIFGTSTGAIIASLLSLGKSVDEVHELYKEHVPRIMQKKSSREKSAALSDLSNEVFGDTMCDQIKTGIGIVATRWIQETPMIFKASVEQAHGRVGTFVPFFGVSVGEAVQASCSAYPYFNIKTVTTAAGDKVQLIDGGFCANSPALYAIADAILALKAAPEHIRVLSVGVGVYPPPKPRVLSKAWAMKFFRCAQLIQKTFEINTQSMEQLRTILYKHLHSVRINEKFERPDMATDLFEHDMDKLNLLRQRGSESYAKNETEMKSSAQSRLGVLLLQQA
jgi:predicted acylesterase/phospholipase RssA